MSQFIACGAEDPSQGRASDRPAPRPAEAQPAGDGMVERKKTWFMVKKDLERAGIAYETEEGFADFHAAGRHSHITELLRSGATLTQTRELARHGDIRMTMRYTHIGIADQATALAGLPMPSSSAAAAG
jgi:hypothetical protein